MVMLLAGASYALGAPAAESPLYISGIQVDPKRPNVVYASTLVTDLDKRSMLKSIDGGKTWSVADTGLTSASDAHGLGRSKGGRARARPTLTQRALRGHRARHLQDDRGARTWKLASSGIDFGGDPLGHRMLEGFIWAIAIDPLHSSTVHAAGNGVWKSTNGAATWKHVLQHGAVNLGIDPRQPEIVYARG